METSLNRTRSWTAEILPLLRPTPNAGRWWIDAFFLLLVGAFHHTIIPAVTGDVFFVDLMTPWLITGFVMQSIPRNILMLMLGSLVLETHSAAPAGFYICAYWVIAAVLSLVRSTLSWRHAFPWLSTFAIGQLWVISFEGFYTAVNSGNWQLSFGQVGLGALRLVVSTGIGMLLCQRFIRYYPSSEQG